MSSTKSPTRTTRTRTKPTHAERLDTLELSVAELVGAVGRLTDAIVLMVAEPTAQVVEVAPAKPAAKRRKVVSKQERREAALGRIAQVASDWILQCKITWQVDGVTFGYMVRGNHTWLWSNPKPANAAEIKAELGAKWSGSDCGIYVANSHVPPDKVAAITGFVEPKTTRASKASKATVAKQQSLAAKVRKALSGDA